jgi:hypothetical protein
LIFNQPSAITLQDPDANGAKLISRNARSGIDC